MAGGAGWLEVCGGSLDWVKAGAGSPVRVCVCVCVSASARGRGINPSAV